MSYQTVRQQLLIIANNPLPEKGSGLDADRLEERTIEAAGAASGGILEEEGLMYMGEEEYGLEPLIPFWFKRAYAGLQLACAWYLQKVGSWSV